MRKVYNDQLDGHLMTYEGLVSLTTGEQPPVELWARIFWAAPEPAAITAPPTRIAAEPPQFLAHLAPERPDLPPDQQPPTWPPPFPLGAEGPVPYCTVSVEAGGRTEVIERLRVLGLDPVFSIEANTWDALLGGTP